MTAGYSGTPLAKKLSLKDGMHVWTEDMPAEVRSEIEASGIAVAFTKSPERSVEAAHLFVRKRSCLESRLRMLLPLLAPNGFVWVSWPKQAAKVPTDVTEDTIRAVALPLGFVDTKVCAVDVTWSGLKLVIRKELR